MNSEECMVCYNCYNSPDDYYTYIFKCDDHNLCDECMGNWMDTFLLDENWSYNIKCPMCRSGLNPALLDMIEDLYGLPIIQ